MYRCRDLDRGMVGLGCLGRIGLLRLHPLVWALKPGDPYIPTIYRLCTLKGP